MLVTLEATEIRTKKIETKQCIGRRSKYENENTKCINKFIYNLNIVVTSTETVG